MNAFVRPPLRGPARWTLTVRPHPTAAWRLFCFPHAGAGASTYSPWGAALAERGIEVTAVQYPGRENRLAEAAATSVTDLVRRLADAWPVIADDRRCAFYGHSMGALLCFELAHELTRRCAAAAPRCVFVSGHNPPHVRPQLPQFSDLTDRALLESLGGEYGGIPWELIECEEMVELIAGILRADFQLVDEYAWIAKPPLAVPLHVLAGTEDPWTNARLLGEWQQHATARISQHWIRGGHGFPQEAMSEVLEVVRAALGRAASIL